MGDIQRADLKTDSAALEHMSKQGDSGRVMNVHDGGTRGVDHKRPCTDMQTPNHTSKHIP